MGKKKPKCKSITDAGGHGFEGCVQCARGRGAAVSVAEGRWVEDQGLREGGQKLATAQ